MRAETRVARARPARPGGASKCVVGGGGGAGVGLRLFSATWTNRIQADGHQRSASLCLILPAVRKFGSVGALLMSLSAGSCSWVGSECGQQLLLGGF
eukprot:366137-Chlamydomonas_euryale.AAC.2